MTAILFSGVFDGFDNNGEVVPYGRLYFTECCTGIPMATYTDSLLTAENTHPVILSASGKAEVFLLDGVYDVTLKDSNDVVIWTVDNYIPPNGTGDTLASGYTEQYVEEFTGVTGNDITLSIVPISRIQIHKNGLLLQSIEYSQNLEDVTFTTPLVPEDVVIVEYIGISEVPSSGVVYSVDVVADLASLDTTKVNFTSVKGRANIDDGGGGIFNYDPTKSGINDGGIVFDGWVRQYDKCTIHASWFNVIDDNYLTDRSTEMMKCITFAEAQDVMPNIQLCGRIRIASSIVLTKPGHHIKGSGKTNVIKISDVQDYQAGGTQIASDCFELRIDNVGSPKLVIEDVYLWGYGTTGVGIHVAGETSLLDSTLRHLWIGGFDGGGIKGVLKNVTILDCIFEYNTNAIWLLPNSNYVSIDRSNIFYKDKTHILLDGSGAGFNTGAVSFVNIEAVVEESQGTLPSIVARYAENGIMRVQGRALTGELLEGDDVVNMNISVHGLNLGDASVSSVKLNRGNNIYLFLDLENENITPASAFFTTEPPENLTIAGSVNGYNRGIYMHSDTSLYNLSLKDLNISKSTLEGLLLSGTKIGKVSIMSSRFYDNWNDPTSGDPTQSGANVRIESGDIRITDCDFYSNDTSNQLANLILLQTVNSVQIVNANLLPISTQTNAVAILNNAITTRMSVVNGAADE